MVVLGRVLDLKHHLSVRIERLNLLAPENAHISGCTLNMNVFQAERLLPKVLSSSEVHLVGARGELLPGEESARPAILVGQPRRHLGPEPAWSHPAQGDGDAGGGPAGSGVEDLAAHRVWVAPDGGPRQLWEPGCHR